MSQQNLDEALEQLASAELIFRRGTPPDAHPKPAEPMLAPTYCAQLGDDATLMSVLSGQSALHFTRAEYMAARECAENLLRLSEKQRDTTAVLLGHVAMGNCLHCLGQFALSKHHLERALAIYAPETHRFPRGAPAVDVKVRTLCFLAYNLFALGYQDQALSRSEQLVLWSRNLHHSYSLAHALSHAGQLHLYRGDEKAAVDLHFNVGLMCCWISIGWARLKCH